MTELTNEGRIAQNNGSLPTVLIIVGSLRAQSFNRQFAQFAQTTLDGKTNVQTLDWKDVPVFNQDAEFPTPQSVAAARSAVEDADALWLFTPEYNHGVPGPLKNLLDWLSRPLEDGSPAAITGKILTVSGVGGSNCVRDSFATLMPTLEFLKMAIAPATFTGVALDREAYLTDRLDLDEAAKASIRKQAEALLGMVADR